MLQFDVLYNVLITVTTCMSSSKNLSIHYIKYNNIVFTNKRSIKKKGWVYISKHHTPLDNSIFLTNNRKIQAKIYSNVCNLTGKRGLGLHCQTPHQ